MEKKNAILAGVSALLMVASGCGKSVAGAYTASLQVSGLTGNCQTTQMNLILTESNGTVSGTASSTCFTESFSGTDSGGTQITGAVLTLTPVSSQQYYSPGQTNTTQNCVYVGNLIVQNKQITGNLVLQPQTQPTGTNAQPVYNNGCMSSVYLSATQVN